MIDVIRNNFNPTVMKIIGTILTAASAIIYAIYRHIKNIQERKDQEEQKMNSIN